MDFETAVGDIEGGKRRVILLGMQIRHVPGSIVLSFIFAEKGLVLNIRFSNTFLSRMKRPYTYDTCARRAFFSAKRFVVIYTHNQKVDHVSIRVELLVFLLVNIEFTRKIL